MKVDVQKLQKLRVDHGLAQRELSEKAGLSPTIVWAIEKRGSGKPSSLKKIADVLGVRASELLKED